MGRPKLWSEKILLNLPEGMGERIAGVLADKEDRSAFVRDAIEREIARRLKARK
jgi:metal-responsive CopG/Arc/MetJ family transcriptional regulator